MQWCGHSMLPPFCLREWRGEINNQLSVPVVSLLPPFCLRESRSVINNQLSVPAACSLPPCCLLAVSWCCLLLHFRLELHGRESRSEINSASCRASCTGCVRSWRALCPGCVKAYCFYYKYTNIFMKRISCRTLGPLGVRSSKTVKGGSLGNC